MSALDGKVAFITGAADGMGRSAALLFAKEGARIVGTDLKTDELHETARLVEAAGGQMHATAPVDLGDPDQVAAWIDEGVTAYGRLDVLYNNASAVRFGTIEDYSVEDWHFTIRNELDLVFFTSKFAWPHLKRAGGVIINTASYSAIRGSQFLGTAGHISAKSAVVGLTKQLAAEGAAHGIRAVSISPGSIMTPATAFLADQADELAKAIPLQRWGTPEDITQLALFLASDAGSYITGTDIVVDGGRSGIE